MALSGHRNLHTDSVANGKAFRPWAHASPQDKGSQDRDSHLQPGVRRNPTSNSLAAIRERAASTWVGQRVWAMLPMRIVLAVVFQMLFAFAYLVTGDDSPWRWAADLWLASFALAELVNLWLLARFARLEGIRLVDLYNPRRAGRSTNLKWTGLAVLVAAPLALIPAALLAQALWSDPEIGQDMLFHPVWVPAAWVMLLVFPVIHALTELPTYYGYVLPRLQSLTSRVALPLVLTASTLSLQHAVLPLLFDTRYLVWRALMFLPLALWFGWVIQRHNPALYGRGARASRHLAAHLRVDRLPRRLTLANTAKGTSPLGGSVLLERASHISKVSHQTGALSSVLGPANRFGWL